MADYTGTPGDDFHAGTVADDTINGEEGKDTLGGGPGNDKIFGGPGDDVLDGGEGVDLLDGGDGDDLLSGVRPSDDVFVTGEGSDHIFWQVGDGNKEIVDFEPGLDMIEIAYTVKVRTFEDLAPFITTEGNDSLIDVGAADGRPPGTQTLFLFNVQDLRARDFLIDPEAPDAEAPAVSPEPPDPGFPIDPPVDVEQASGSPDWLFNP
jgi:Ca2+-binding RTX toxin-like protein